METSQNSALSRRIGLFVLLTLVLIAALYLGLGEVVFRSHYMVRARFNYVGGIKVGTPVYIGGVSVGEVTQLIPPSASRNWVELVMSISSQVRIKDDAQLTVESVGLIGDKVLEFTLGTPGAKDLPTDGKARVKGHSPPSLANLQQSVEEATSALKDILKKVSAIISQPGVQENLGRTLAGAADFTHQGAQFFETANKTVHHLDTQVGQTVQDADKVLTKINGFVDDLHAMMDKLSKALDQVQLIVSKISQGEGTLGKLVTDKELYIEARDTLSGVEKLSRHSSRVLNHLDEVLQDVKAGVATKKGTLGRLLNDEKLYDEAVAVVERLKETSTVIKQTADLAKKTLQEIYNEPSLLWNSKGERRKREKMVEEYNKVERGSILRRH